MENFYLHPSSFASMYDINSREHERATGDLHRAECLTEQRHRGNRRDDWLTEQRRRHDGRRQMTERVIDREPANNLRDERERNQTVI